MKEILRIIIFCKQQKKNDLKGWVWLLIAWLHPDGIPKEKWMKKGNFLGDAILQASANKSINQSSPLFG